MLSESFFSHIIMKLFFEILSSSGIQIPFATFLIPNSRYVLRIGLYDLYIEAGHEQLAHRGLTT